MTPKLARAEKLGHANFYDRCISSVLWQVRESLRVQSQIGTDWHCNLHMSASDTTTKKGWIQSVNFASSIKMR